eukprot:323475-Karenia_brevis.AAC.1
MADVETLIMNGERIKTTGVLPGTVDDLCSLRRIHEAFVKSGQQPVDISVMIPVVDTKDCKQAGDVVRTVATIIKQTDGSLVKGAMRNFAFVPINPNGTAVSLSTAAKKVTIGH